MKRKIFSLALAVSIGFVPTASRLNTTFAEEINQEISQSSFGTRTLVLTVSDEAFDRLGAQSVVRLGNGMYAVSYADSKAAKEAYEVYRKMPDILAVEEDLVAKTAQTDTERDAAEDVPVIPNEQSVSGGEGKDVTVAVIDTGVNPGNAKLQGRLLEPVAVYPDENAADGNGHGTLMAEIIAQNTGENVKILPIKAVDNGGFGTSAALCEAVGKAVGRGVDVIYLGVSGKGASGAIETAVRQAKKAGIPVVVPAGNDGNDVQSYFPGNIEDAWTVSAVDEKNAIEEYSNTGSRIDFAAYGSYVSGSTPHTGTSVAAAFVTAEVAKCCSDGKTEGWDGLYLEMQKTAEDIGEAGRDPLYGEGLVSDNSFFETEEKEPEGSSGKEEKEAGPDTAGSKTETQEKGEDRSLGTEKTVEPVELEEIVHIRAASNTAVGCTSWSQVKSAVESGKTRIRIDGDINANSTITIPSGRTVAIFPQSSGNYSITRSTTFVGGSLFSVKGTLTIEASSAVNASTGAKTLLSIRGRQSTMYAGAPLLTVDGGTLNLTAGYLGWNKFLKDPDNPDVLSGDGGCIRVNSGTFYMTGGVIEQSAALNGGGVSVQSGASFFMTGGQIVGNRTAQSTKEQNDTTGNGGGVVVYGNFVMTGGAIGGDFTSGGNVFSGNTADFAGGIGIISGNVTISGGTLSKNAATKHGGAVHLYGAKSTETGRLDLTGGTIMENTAPRGGGIFLSTRGILNIGTASTAPTISRNVSTTTTNEFGGGGIYASSNASGFVIENGVFDGNTAAMHGGAVATQTTTSISGGQFVRNSAKSGGAVRSSGTLLVSGGLFGGGRDTDGNTAGDSGAAISQSGGNTMTFSGGTISHNSGGIGALFVASNGKLDMRGGEIHSNTNTSGIAVNSNASSSGTAVISGGNIYGNAAAGVWNSGSVTLSGTTVVRNNATYGILNNGSGTLCMEKGSIYGNGNAAQATGGGIYNGGTAVFTGGAVYGNAGYGLTNAGTCQVNGNFMVGIYSYSGEGNYSASANYSGCVKNSGTLTAGGLLAYAANAPCLENTGNATFTSANGTNSFFSYKTPAVVKNAGRLYIGAKSAGASFADTLVLCAEDAESGIENTGTLVCGGLYVAGEYTVTGIGSHADNGYHIKTGICNTGTGRYDTGSFAQTVSLCDYAEIKNCLENGIDNKAGTVKIWGNAKIHNGKGMGIKNAGTVTMAGGTIAENNTGVYNSGVFDLTGGNITKNEKGVHQGGTFYMSKAAGGMISPGLRRSH